ncbi:MAG: oligopeptidase A, partial [Methylococcaceae bacterium]|nr:oligopeptidase A [Methylococcaceae bacterium]
MTNPLLETTELPQFSKIKAEHIVPAIEQLLNEARAAVKNALAANTDYNWENLVEPIEEAEDRLSKAWSPVGHLNGVLNSDELRDAYNACLPKLSEYSTEMGQNKDLFNAYQSIANSVEFETLDVAQKKIIDNALKDFRLSGIDLDSEKQQRYKEISQQLSELCSRYSDNVLDATNAWTKLISDETELKGLPESAMIQAKQSAEMADGEGWLISLQFPSYIAVMTYADNRELRHEHYQAFAT